MIRQGVVTLNGASQNLATALSLTGDKDVPVRALILQPRATNSNVIYVGVGTVTTTAYVVRLEAPATAIPPAPFILGETPNGTFRLSEISVLGTNAEHLHVGIVT